VLVFDTHVDVSDACPALGHAEVEETHVVLQGLRWSIIVPQLQTPLNIVISARPVSLNIRFERLPEYRVEFLDMLLQPNNITIQSEHVVDPLVLETLDIDGLILLEFNKVTNLMVFF